MVHSLCLNLEQTWNNFAFLDEAMLSYLLWRRWRFFISGNCSQKDAKGDHQRVKIYLQRQRTRCQLIHHMEFRVFKIVFLMLEYLGRRAEKFWTLLLLLLLFELCEGGPDARHQSFLQKCVGYFSQTRFILCLFGCHLLEPPQILAEIDAICANLTSKHYLVRIDKIVDRRRFDYLFSTAAILLLLWLLISSR